MNGAKFKKVDKLHFDESSFTLRNEFDSGVANMETEKGVPFHKAKENAEKICNRYNNNPRLIESMEWAIRQLTAWDKATGNGKYKNIIAHLQGSIDKANN